MAEHYPTTLCPASSNDLSRWCAPSTGNCREERDFAYRRRSSNRLDQIKSAQDMQKALLSVHRDTSIAAVMEKEVLSKHRKALMLMGTFHLMHGAVGSAVSLDEKEYPNVTLVISDLGAFDTDLPDPSSSPFAAWPIPALARVRGTWMGKLD